MDLKTKHDALIAESDKGQKYLQELQREIGNTQQSLLRIEGAILVLRELDPSLAQAPTLPGPEPVQELAQPLNLTEEERAALPKLDPNADPNGPMALASSVDGLEEVAHA